MVKAVFWVVLYYALMLGYALWLCWGQGYLIGGRWVRVGEREFRVQMAWWWRGVMRGAR